jgi:hypothetical protein
MEEIRELNMRSPLVIRDEGLIGKDEEKKKDGKRILDLLV